MHRRVDSSRPKRTCRMLADEKFVYEKSMTVLGYRCMRKLRTCTYGDVPMTGGGFDDWHFFRLRLPYRYLRRCLSGSSDFFQSLSHFLSLNRLSPPWVIVCFRSVILSLIALLTMNARCYTVLRLSLIARVKTIEGEKKILNCSFRFDILLSYCTKNCRYVIIIIITSFYTYQISAYFHLRKITKKKILSFSSIILAYYIYNEKEFWKIRGRNEHLVWQWNLSV